MIIVLTVLAIVLPIIALNDYNANFAKENQTMKMKHDAFEAWIRDRCRGCIEQDDIDQLCIGELDFDSGEYTFLSTEVQGQWEAWQAATEHAKKTMCNRN